MKKISAAILSTRNGELEHDCCHTRFLASARSAQVIARCCRVPGVRGAATAVGSFPIRFLTEGSRRMAWPIK
jgi:hypothetical protein